MQLQAAGAASVHHCRRQRLSRNSFYKMTTHVILSYPPGVPQVAEDARVCRGPWHLVNVDFKASY